LIVIIGKALGALFKIRSFYYRVGLRRPMAERWMKSNCRIDMTSLLVCADPTKLLNVN